MSLAASSDAKDTALAEFLRTYKIFPPEHSPETSQETEEDEVVGPPYEVLSGEEMKTHQTVMIKVWDFRRAAYSQLGFENERRAIETVGLHRVSHKPRRTSQNNFIQHICQTLSSGFVVMKRQHHNLLQYVEAATQFSEALVQRIFWYACEAVHTLHSASVAHLNISPENFYYDERLQQPYLAHFECAFVSSAPSPHKRRSSESLETVTMLGRRGMDRYSPPETFDSPDCYDPYRCDVYSMGVLLHFLATREHPHIAETGCLSDEPNVLDLECHRTQFPSEACFRVVQEMLCDNPEKRPSMGEVLKMPWVLSGKSRGKIDTLLKTREVIPRLVWGRKLKKTLAVV